MFALSEGQRDAFGIYTIRTYCNVAAILLVWLVGW